MPLRRAVPVAYPVNFAPLVLVVLVVTATSAWSVAVTFLPCGSVPVAVAMLVKARVTVGLLQL